MNRTCIVTLILLLAIAAGAHGGVVRITGASPYQATVIMGPVGEFSAGANFQTFCLEYPEFLVSGKMYESTLNTNAVLGGLVWQDNNGNDGDGNFGEDRVGSGGTDPLDPISANIYQSYIDGEFTDGYAVQRAIHYAEAEVGSISGTALTYFNTARGRNPSDLGNVRVLNLYNYIGPEQPNGDGLPSSIRYRQDVLVTIDGPALVPSPGALLLGSFGVGLVGYLRRRKTL